MTVDLLVFGPHPDDIELGCGGSVIKATRSGLDVGLIDMSAGEKGTRGTPEERLKEAEKAKQILGVQFRENMFFPDSFITPSIENVLKVANKIREHAPTIVMAPYWKDRHPDHVATSEIVRRAVHYAKLPKIELEHPPHRVTHLIFYELNYHFNPLFIIDISDVFEEKKQAILAYKSQFARFEAGVLPFPLMERSRYLGAIIGVEHAEGFYVQKPLKLNNWNLFFKC